VSPRAEIELAQARMLEASIRLEKQFEASDAYRKALRDLREAERDLDLARSQAHRALQDSRDYHLALAAERQAARNVEAVQASYREPPSAPPATQPFPLPLVMAAQHKLDASRQLSEIESEALANNPAVKNARARLEAAADRLETLRAKFEASLVTDPEWLAAKRRLDAARAGLLPEPAIDSSEP
jgi:DNA repair exonuclease SbcCD ATPase subunit